VPIGEYRVLVGLYSLAGGKRLPTAEGADTVDLGAVRLVQ
jgi:hypothetical protein